MTSALLLQALRRSLARMYTSALLCLGSLQLRFILFSLTLSVLLLVPVIALAQAADGSTDAGLQALGFIEYLWRCVEKGDWWPVAAVLPLALMYGGHIAAVKYPSSKFMKLLATPLGSAVIAALTASCGVTAHALAAGHPLDKVVAVNVGRIFAASLISWVFIKFNLPALPSAPAQPVPAPAAAK